MIFQTHSNVTSIPHIFITHSYYRIKLILTTVSQDNLSIFKAEKSNTNMYYKFVLYQCQSCVTILYIITVITEIKIIAILVNNAFKTVQQRAKDKEDICRRADARQRYLTQDFTL